MRLTLVDPPEMAPLTAADARELGGISGTDAAIEGWIESARATLDGWHGVLGRALITQTWDMDVGGFPGCRYPQMLPAQWSACNWSDPLRMPLPPLQSVTSIKYRDFDGGVITLDPSRYRVLPGDPGFIVVAGDEAWPSTDLAPDAVTIRFVAGYGDEPATVPQPIRLAMALSLSMISSAAARDPSLTREVVEGVGEFAYSSGVQSASMISGQVGTLLSAYRVGGGIS